MNSNNSGTNAFDINHNNNNNIFYSCELPHGNVQVARTHVKPIAQSQTKLLIVPIASSFFKACQIHCAKTQSCMPKNTFELSPKRFTYADCRVYSTRLRNMVAPRCCLPRKMTDGGRCYKILNGFQRRINGNTVHPNRVSHMPKNLHTFPRGQSHCA